VCITTNNQSSRCLPRATPVVDAASVRELVDGLRRSMIACSKRVDRSFSSVWLDRLSSSEFERAARCLNLQVAATLVCIVRAEKKHLLGQEMRKARSRGAALSATELGKRTYEKSIAIANTKKSESVLQDVLAATSRSSFSRSASALAVQKRKRGVHDAVKAARARMSRHRGKATTLSGWVEYRRIHWNPSIRLGTPESTEEQKRVRGLWERESEQCKSHMQALADVRTRTITQADACGSIAEVSQLDLGSEHVVKSARGRALRRSLLTIRDHPAWTSGSCTDEYALGLKPSKVDVTSSNAQICAAANKIFGFDAMPLRNNPGTALPETVCVAHNGGVCVHHSFFYLVTNVVKNIYRLLTAKGSVRISSL